MPKKLVIICTHPIQYYAPVFRLLAASPDIRVHVVYTMGDSKNGHADKGFGRTVQWDIPLLDGYPHISLRNTAKDPGSHHFKGIDNPDILEQVKSLNPDAVLVYGWAYKSHLRILRHFKGKIPVMFRGDSTLLDEKPGIRTFLRRISLKWVYRHIDLAFYVGTENKRYFLKHGLHKEQLVFAPHAIDNNRFRATADNAPGYKKDLHISPDAKVILFAGKFLSKKDPAILLEAFSRLKMKDTHLVLVGNGTLESELKAQSSGNKFVHFLDFQNQSQMPGIYQMADLFCLPSAGPGETWGLAVNEAMAAGKAVLISDKTGCATDLVKPGINGDIFTAGNLPDLMKKLELLLSSKITLEKMGQESRRIIATWTPEIQKDIIVDTVLNF